MRGYYRGRMLDRSAVAAALHYSWPIAPWVGGTIEAAVGIGSATFEQGGHIDSVRVALSVNHLF